ncbi:MAG: YcjX family protein, partial [Pseudomonadota bacterium]
MHDAMILDDLATSARDWLTPTVRLGVTGLSRAGKTVFITALVDNLLNGGRLPFFEPVRQGLITAVYLEPQPDDTVPRFAYERHRTTLRGTATTDRSTRDWPDGTRTISQLRLTFEYEPADFLSRSLASLTGRSRLHLDIVDYPGEWLLDLPLLERTYDDWAREAVALARAPLRSTYARDWLAWLERTPPSASQDDATAEEGARLFRAYLSACRDASHVLSTLSPGRFLLPGDLDGSPALTFSPLDLEGNDTSASNARSGTLHAMMARRFEAYKSQVVKPFYADHFARLDRQVVLVDALAALNTGPEAVADLERALAQVLASFRTGGNSWLSFIIGRRIDRLLFAATKADHLHETSHDRLVAILGVLTDAARGQADFNGAVTASEAIASVRATRQASVREAGEELACIIGTPMAGETIDGKNFHGNREAAIFPGDLPDDPHAALARAHADGFQQQHIATPTADALTTPRERARHRARPARQALERPGEHVEALGGERDAD